jgi:AcrR family transcriptional regulator
VLDARPLPHEDEESADAGPRELLTARGARTRDRLLVAARQVFEEHGFHDARVTDISKAANVAHGTFYTYFDSKEDVFREVLKRMQVDMHALRSTPPAGLTPAERIAHANRGFYEAYRRNLRMMAVLEQVASFENDLRDLRREMRNLANLRSSRAIARWQAEGLIDPDLDPRYVASALGSMVDRSLYVWLVLGEPFDEEEGLATLNTLCIRALGLDREPAARPAPRRPRH